MLAVVAMNVHWSRQIPDRCDETDRLVTGDAIVADREVDVPQPVASCRLHVRLRAIDADDRLNAQPLERLEALLVLGLSTAEQAGAEPEDVLDAGSNDPLGL
jgi:hypothetical protein